MSSSILQSNIVALKDFYAKYDPAKQDKVEDILKGWPILELQEALKKKYGENPNLVVEGKPSNKVADDVISSDDDLVVVSADLKKPKDKKLKKKEKKDKLKGNKKDKSAKPKGVDDPTVAKANASLPAQWGRQAPSVPANGKPEKWWNHAISDINAVKRRLTQQAMKFVDEAVRRKLDEKRRRTAELREAKQKGLAKEDVAVIVEDDVEVAAPPPTIAEEDEEEFRRSDFNIDGYVGPGRAESDDGSDNDNGGARSLEVSSRIYTRKPTDKEQMSKALEEHFEQLSKVQADDEEAPAEGFTNFDSFDARKAHDLAHGIQEGDVDSDPDSHPSDDSSDEDARERQVLDYWGTPPEELLSRSDLEDSVDGSRAFVAHFVRYVMGVWQKMFSEGCKIQGNGLTDYVTSSFNSAMVIDKTREALTPLLIQLQRNTISEALLLKIDSVVTLATQCDYAKCMQEYVLITMGRKTWHASHTQTMMQQNHGGSIAKILTASQFIDFDYDPTVNAYTLALKRLIQFVQWLRPPTMPSAGIGI